MSCIWMRTLHIMTDKIEDIEPPLAHMIPEGTGHLMLPVVILDEATAYIDPENEAVIQKAIARLVRGKTVIVIAHRLSTIKDADKIVVVKDGRISINRRQSNL